MTISVEEAIKTINMKLSEMERGNIFPSNENKGYYKKVNSLCSKLKNLG